VHKNTAAPIIVMLGCLEIDTEVSDPSMETVESDDCRGMSGNNRNTNGVLAAMQERVRFSYKDGWKFIDPFIQSISELCQVSQLYSRIKEQEESSRMI